jgi:multiple sugar transport system ATP-binding protein
MDEPLSNLDAKMRVQTRAEISKLHQRLQTTMVYVTHDQVEAMTMGDRITVMKDGLLQQVDTPRNIYNNPANMFVAGFVGSPPMNFMTANVEQSNGTLYLTTADTGPDSALRLRVPSRFKSALEPYSGKAIIFGIRPQDIYDARYSNSMLDEGDDPEDFVRVKTKVDVVEPMGSEINLYLLTGQTSLVANVDPRTDVQPGHALDIALNMDRMHAFDPENQVSLIDKNSMT